MSAHKREVVVEDMKNRTGIVISLTSAVTLFLFAPLEVYLSNITEFWFSLELILPIFLLATVVVFIFIFGMLVILKQISKLYEYACYGIWVLTMLLYIQGNYLLGGLSIMNGSEAEHKVFSPAGIVSIIVWSIGIVISIVLFVKYHKAEKFPKIYCGVAVCLIAVETVTIGTLLIQNADSLNKSEYYATTEGEVAFAPKNNCVVLLLDGFSSNNIDKLLNDDEKYTRDVLEDFTYYSDTMSVFDITVLSVPEILTGEKYLNETSFEKYLCDSYEKSPILNYANEKNWNIGIYTTCDFPNSGMVENITNLADSSECGLSSIRSFCITFYRMVAYKYAPYFMKTLFYFYPEAFDYMQDSDESNTFDWNNGTFMGELDNVKVEDADGTFKFIHLKGYHGDWTTGVDGYDIKNGKTTETEVLRGNLALIDKFKNELRENGIYDDTTLIVLADHGLEVDGIASKQNPVLLIKGRNERHDFSQNDIPLSYEDIQTILLRLCNGETSAQAVEGLQREERTFYVLDKMEEANGQTFATSIQEFVSNGEARDYSNLQETGMVY